MATPLEFESVPSTTICSVGPVHCTMVTAIDCRVPDMMAFNSSGLRKAAT